MQAAEKFPMLRLCTLSFAVLGLLFSSSFAVSQTASPVPSLVKFNGTVQSPRSNIIGLTFSLYRDEQGGPPLWMETQTVPLDHKGGYNVQLGATLPDGLPRELFASGEARWLGVRPEGQEEQPRILLLSVPYALKAADAETIGGLPPSAFVLTGQQSGESTAVRGKSVGPRSNRSSPGPMVLMNVTTAGGTVNSVPLFTTASDIENSLISQNGTAIGINTTAPLATLDVNGTANIRGSLTASGFVGSTGGFLINGSLFAYEVNGPTNAFFGLAGNTATSGTGNVGIGYKSMATSTSGNNNTGIGVYSLLNNGTGTFNTGLGEEALGSNTAGSYNTAVGVKSLNYNTTGNENTAVGNGSLLQNTGSYNSAVGHYTLSNNTSGTYNTGVGLQALYNNSVGNYNTALGYLAGTDSSVTISNATAIGSFADVKASNAMVLGSIAGVNFAAADTNVGIGTTTPTAKLHLGNPSIAGTTSLRIEGPSASGTGAFAVSLGGYGDLGVDAPGVSSGRFVVKENGRVGIGTASPDNTLSVNGSADKTGGGSWGTFSDQRLKDLQGGFTAGLSQVLKINPVRYRYKETNGMDIHDSEQHVGLVAQEVQKVIPEAVSENIKGYLLVNNDPIIWAMLNAIKEQQQQIRQQRSRARAQDAAIRSLRSQLQQTRQSLSEIKSQLKSAQPALVAAK